MDDPVTLHCPICNCLVLDIWYEVHMEYAHPVDEDTIRASVVDRGYYNYMDFAWEQRNES